MIDDGSIDQSGSICESYAKRYENIYVYHQENQGQAVARNNGLDKCKGEYIGFVDSDDYISFDMYAYLYNLIDQYKADCGSIQFKLTSNDAEIIDNNHEHISVYEGRNILEAHLFEATSATGAHSVCRCLVKRNVIENIRFPVGIINEDIPYKFSMLSSVHRMVDSNLVKYYYYQKGMSTTRGAFKEKDLNLFKATELMQRLAGPYNERIRGLAKAKHERGYFSILARIAFYGSAESKERTWEVVRMCQEHLRSNYLFLLRMPLPVSRKILIVLFCVNFNFTAFIIKMIKNIRS